MKYNKNIYTAIFLRRPNRFNAVVNLNGEEITVHVPNTGRCREILKEGSIVFLREELNKTRKTKYDLISVIKGEDLLISIDSQIPNKVVFEALTMGKIDKLRKFDKILKEKTYGKSRFDFKLSTCEEKYFLEVKGVTLERSGHARFPDAPTERGCKHIMELIDAKKNGYGAGILFLIQMNGITKFSPNDETDKRFGDALRLAVENDVDIFAYNCIVDNEGIEINDKVDIIL